MKFNRNNYEEYALDYVENNFSFADRQEFESFLLLNPDIKEELEQFELITLPLESNVLYERKELLYRKPKSPFRFWPILAVLAIVILGVMFYPTAKKNTVLASADQSVMPIQDEYENLEKRIKPLISEIKKDESASLESGSEKDLKKEGTAQSISSLPTYNHESPASEEKENEVGEVLNDTDIIKHIEIIEDDRGAVQQISEVGEIEQDRQRKANPIQMIPLSVPLEIRGTIYRPIEIIHPALIEQYRQDLESQKENKKFGRWLTHVVPDAFRKGENQSIKERLLPEYMVAQ